jgi:hypothetical protein
MNKNNKYLVSIIALVLLTSLMTGVSAGAKVYFFQKTSGTTGPAAASGTYTLSSDYKLFGDRLREMGYDVSELRSGLTREALSTYGVDVLILTPLTSDLTSEEMSAVYKFAMDDGKGVFIIGATPSASKITTPMGMMVVEDALEDEVNQVLDKATGLRIADKTTFSIDLPATKTDLAVNSITKGVSTVNVFGANGIYRFGKSRGVILAGDAANSPKSLYFPKGSNPPVAAYVKLGRGMVFFLSDPDMLTNKYMDASKYRSDNLKLATNVVDWLSTPSTEDLSDDQMEDLIKSLNVEKMSLNRTINSLNLKEKNMTSQITNLTSIKNDLSDSLAGCQNTKLLGLEYIIWAIIFAGVLVAVSLFFAMKKKGRGKKSKKEGGELGYEFDSKNAGGGEFSEGEAKIDGEVKEEDIEERLKELEKKGSEQQA